MSVEPIVAIDTVKRLAKETAARGLALADACPWRFESAAGKLFKQEFFFHKAALQALDQETQS